MAAVDTTKLTAVNDVLEGARQAPVSALGSTRDATIAERILDRTNEAVQAEEWVFNKEFEVTLSEAAGEIAVPSDVTQVVSYASNIRKFSVRDGKLYDLDNNTFTWATGASVKVMLTRLLDVDALEPAARGYVVARARRRYAANYLGDSQILRELRAEEFMSRATLMNHEARTAGMSALNGWSAGRVIYRRGQPLLA